MAAPAGRTSAPAARKSGRLSLWIFVLNIRIFQKPSMAAPGSVLGLFAQRRAREAASAEDGAPWDFATAERGLRMRNLTLSRIFVIAAELVALFVVFPLSRQTVPAAADTGLAAVQALAAAATASLVSGSRVLRPLEAVGHLALDVGLIVLLVALNGGFHDPLVFLALAPVVVATASLRPSDALIVAGIAALCGAGLAFAPLPPVEAVGLIYPEGGRWLAFFAFNALLAFMAGYSAQANLDAARMELAFNATQAVLAREQRLSALGGLAASAAHELGSPLSTIQVVAKEMRRVLQPGDTLYDDVELLAGQADRCRDILRRLSRSPEMGALHPFPLTVSQLLDEVAEPYAGGVIRVTGEVACAPEAPPLMVRRLPEILHGVAAFIENAVDFAASTVEMTAYYDEAELSIEVRDDGPGFPPEVLARLGEPYVTTRSQGEGSRSHHQGMGLGFFIAKTLLERSGAEVGFRNARRGGALIHIRWPRRRIEAEGGPL